MMSGRFAVAGCDQRVPGVAQRADTSAKVKTESLRMEGISLNVPISALAVVGEEEFERRFRSQSYRLTPVTAIMRRLNLDRL
jgi:hypothetical protein